MGCSLSADPNAMDLQLSSVYDYFIVHICP